MRGDHGKTRGTAPGPRAAKPGIPAYVAPHAVIVIPVAAGCLSPGHAAANAMLMESEPAAHATVRPGPTGIRQRFNSRIDHARSRLALRNGPAERVLALDPAGPADVMAASSDLAPSAGVLRWRVLAVDGHVTRGEVPLTVQAQSVQAP